MRSADLRFDTEAFQKAITDYENLMGKMTDLKDDLEKQLEDLKSTSWNSYAGSMFQTQYEKTWKKNVETYTEFLLHLTETLGTVKEKYELLYERAKSLDIS